MHILLKFGPHKVAKEILTSPESLLKRNCEVDENYCYSSTRKMLLNCCNLTYTLENLEEQYGITPLFSY